MIDTRHGSSGPKPKAGEDQGRRAFGAFYTAHHPIQMQRAMVLARSTDTAADAVHEAFVDVFRNWERLQNPVAYLQRAVVNRCRDDGRRSSTRDRLRRRLLREPVPETLTTAPATFGRFDDDELWDALVELPFNQRAAIVLRYFAGHTEAEIADILDCSTGSVGPWINRGLAKIRRRLTR